MATPVYLSWRGSFSWWPFTLSESFDNAREIDESEEHEAQRVELGEDTMEAFGATNPAFDLESALVNFAVEFPWFRKVGCWVEQQG
jgi:hypothetical protein